jgi:2,5-diketo-D-gluconate reductase A
MRASGVPREALFVETKFNRVWHGVDLVRDAFEANAARLGVDYIDLLLIHWPNPAQDRYVAAWEGMIRLREEGLVRAIGTSNFKPAHIERLIRETGVSPEVNQVQLNPTLARDATRAYDTDHGIVTQSWSPIGQGRDLLAKPTVLELAERYGKTPAQIVLRWHMELGLAAIPKTSDPVRMMKNIDVFDFGLKADDVAALSALDRGEAAAVDSDVFGH